MVTASLLSREKNIPMDIPVIFHSYSAAISSDIDRNRPEAMEKYIGDSINSKKPWRTVQLGAHISPKSGPGTQNMYAQSAL